MAVVRTEPVAPGTDLDSAREMLVLSMLSYRAYHDLRPGEVQLARLRRAVERGLTELPVVADRWELVWGPAAYRAPFTVFDENVLYVVRNRTDTRRFAVVTRGTNPVSLADWLFGDLWTGLLTSWPFGDADDREGSPLLEDTCRGEQLFRNIHRLNVNAARHCSSRVSYPLVEGAGQTGNRVH